MNRYTVDSCALLLRPGSTKGMSKLEVCDELNELTAKVEALEGDKNSLATETMDACERAQQYAIEANALEAELEKEQHENKRLLALIDAALHEYGCGYYLDMNEDYCGCFKSKARMEPPAND